MSIPPPLPDTGSGPVSVPPPLPAEPPVVAPPLDSPRDPRHSRFASFLVFLMGMFLLYPVAQLIGPAALPSQRAKIAIEQGYFQMDNEEGALLYLTLELGRGHTMYRPLTEFPYVVGTYPPLYFWLNSWFVNADRPGFAIGRVLAAASAMGIALLIAVIISGRAKNRSGTMSLGLAIALAGALMFLASYEVYRWIAYYRVDLPAIFLSLLGFTLVALGGRFAAVRVLAIVFLTAGWYCKQTTIAAPAACVLALMARDWRLGLRFAASLALSIGVVFAFLCAVTRGQYFLHTISYNVNTWRWSDVLIWIRHVKFMHWWLLMAAAIVTAGWAIVATFRMWPEENPTHWKRPVEGFWLGFVFDPAVLYFAFTIGGFFMIGKAGSAENYLLEPLAALAIFLGCGMGRLGEAAVRKSAGMILPFGFLVGATACLAVHTHIIATPEAQQLRFSQYDRLNMLDLRASEEVRRTVRASQTPTFTEYAIFNLQSGRDPVLQPFIMSELARQGKWDQTPFLKMLEDQKLKLIVTNSNVLSLEATDVYTKEMLDHFKRYYKLEKMIPTGSKRFFYLLRPKTEEDRASEGDNLVMQFNKPAIISVDLL